MTRTSAREIAIQLGFAAVAAGQEPETVVQTFLDPEHYDSMTPEGDLYGEKPSKRDAAFIAESVAGVVARREELDGYIGRYAKGWRVERISRSAAAILRQAMYEILYMNNTDVPVSTSINEAVEIAKGYEDAEVVAFINGVLGGFYRGEVLHEAVEEDIPVDEPAADTAEDVAPADRPAEEIHE